MGLVADNDDLCTPEISVLLDSIRALLASHDHGALTVLSRSAGRYAMGLKAYGPLEPTKDKRKYLRELSDELHDAIMYLEAELIREEKK